MDSSNTGEEVSDSGGLLNIWLIIQELLVKQRLQFNSTDIECQSSVNMIIIYEIALLPALAIVAVACMSVSRSHLLPNLFGGKPGLAEPLNILEDTSTRFPYALAFGIAAQLCYDLLFGQSGLYVLHVSSNSNGQYKFLHVLYRFCEVCLYSAVMYPIFITISMGNKLFYCLGSLYTWCLTTVAVIRLVTADCQLATSETQLTLVLKYLPSVACMIGLSVLFPYRLYQITSGRNSKFIINKVELDKQAEYVRSVLRMRPKVVDAASPDGFANDGASKIVESLKQNLQKLRQSSSLSFRYSPRVICTFTTTAIVVYMVIYMLINEYYYYDRLMHKFLKMADSIGSSINADRMKELTASAEVYLNVLSKCIIASTVLAILLNIINIFMALRGYKLSLIEMYKGNFQSYPLRTEITTTATFLLLNSIRFSGYQIAFTSIAVIMQVIMFQTILAFVCLVLFDPELVTLRPWFTETLEYSWPLLTITATVLSGQYLLTMLAFNSKYSSSRNIGLNNRNLLFNWTYLMFYFNAFWGIITATIRLFLSILLGICFLSRLDWCFFPKRFEVVDEGYFSYVGMLYVENAHTNPILRVFVSELLNSTNRSNGFSSPSVSVYTQKNVQDLPRRSRCATGLRMKRRIRNMWNLAVTLINNPGLIQLRTHRINSFQETLKRRRLTAALISGNSTLVASSSSARLCEN